MSLYDTLYDKMQGKQYVGYFAAMCPFDSHKTAALMVNEHSFRCMSCGKRGSLKYLYEVVTKSDYVPEKAPSDKVVPRFRQWLDRYGSIEEIAYHAHRFIKANGSYARYLKNRKADQFIEPGMFGFLEGWITIPVRDEQDKIVDIICRGISKNKTRYVLLREDKTPRLYVPDWQRINKISNPVIYVPFGIFDSWALWEMGKPTVTGTTGTSLSASLLKPLEKLFVIIPDKGEEHAAYRLANGLGWRADVKRIKYPSRTKDLDEIRRTYNNKQLLHLLEA